MTTHTDYHPKQRCIRIRYEWNMRIRQIGIHTKSIAIFHCVFYILGTCCDQNCCNAGGLLADVDTEWIRYISFSAVNSKLVFFKC